MATSTPNSVPSWFGEPLPLQAPKRRVIRVHVRVLVTPDLGGHYFCLPTILLSIFLYFIIFYNHNDEW